MRVVVVLLALASAIVVAADYAATASKPAANLMPQAVSCGAEAISIPQMLCYQGRLTDTLGVPVADTVYSVTFRLYTVPSGGSSFWNENQNVTTRAGLFTVLLGAVTPVGSVPAAGGMYLGMAVGGGVELTPRLRIVSAAYAYKADTANYALAGGTADNAWARQSPPNDSILWTVHSLGITRGGASNNLYGSLRYTHTNLGNSCATGASGSNRGYCAVGGGLSNVASGEYATVAGGYANTASGASATIGGGESNTANNSLATVGGGTQNVAGNTYATVAGGQQNHADSNCATVGGGYYNGAGRVCATVAGGWNNNASGMTSTVSGGKWNVASGERSVVAGGESNEATGVGATVGGGYIGHAYDDNATIGGGWSNTVTGPCGTVAGGHENIAGDGNYPAVGGGHQNRASGDYATVPGGYRDTAFASYSFAANVHSVAGNDNAAAFNNRTTRANNSLRCAIIDPDVLCVSMDHPLDPDGTILGQFGICSPELVLLYRGTAFVGAGGRVEVSLPAYFDAANRNPMIQVSGVGTSDVFVAEKEANNRFVIGGRPGTEVFWTVTGERNDPVGQMYRLTLPVEQPRTGHLVGRSITDDALVGLQSELQRLGYGGRFTFRTAAGRTLYEELTSGIDGRK
jgi:hypothetical protein